MKTKIVAVLLTLCLCLSFTVCFASAANTKNSTASTTQKSSSGTQSYIVSILRGLLGDAASNLTNSELLSIAQKIMGNIDISTLLGSGSSDVIKEILEYINSVETTTDVEAATKPAETEPPATTEAPTTQPATEPAATVPATTAQPQSSYIYVYVDTNTTTGVVASYETATTEATTSPYAYYTYAPGTEVVEELSGANGLISSQDDAKPMQFTVKTIIGLVVMLAAGAAVVILCLRKKASY